MLTKEEAAVLVKQRAICLVAKMEAIHKLAKTFPNLRSSWGKRITKQKLTLMNNEVQQLSDEIRFYLGFIKEVPEKTLTDRLK